MKCAMLTTYATEQEAFSNCVKLNRLARFEPHFASDVATGLPLYLTGAGVCFDFVTGKYAVAPLFVMGKQAVGVLATSAA